MIEFVASLVSRPIAIDDEGESTIKLVAPSSELASVMRLALMGKTALRIKIEEEPS